MACGIMTCASTCRWAWHSTKLAVNRTGAAARVDLIHGLLPPYCAPYYPTYRHTPVRVSIVSSVKMGRNRSTTSSGIASGCQPVDAVSVTSFSTIHV